MLLHSLAPLTRSSPLVPGRHSAASSLASHSAITLLHPSSSLPQAPALRLETPLLNQIPPSPWQPDLHPPCPLPVDSQAALRGEGVSLCPHDPPAGVLRAWECQGSGCRQGGAKILSAAEQGQRQGNSLGGQQSQPHSSLSGRLAVLDFPEPGGASQLRAFHVARASNRALLRLSPGWSTRHSSPSPHLHTALRRSAGTPSPSLSPPSSSSSSPAHSPASPRAAPGIPHGSSLQALLRARAALGGASRGPLSSLPGRSGSSSPGTLGTFTSAAWLGQWQRGPSWAEDDLAAAVRRVDRILAVSGSAESAGEVTGLEEAEGGDAAPRGSGTTEETASLRRETSYAVTRVPGDGRCLFSAVVYGLCFVSGNPIPTSYLMRSQWADKLRQLVADEFVKRREETEWFLEGPFDDYVENIRRPHVWGGEPELLMLTHVLRYPITVYILDPRYGSEEEAIIPIAEYGQEYTFSPDGLKPLLKCMGDEETQPRVPIRVLYNGYNHYDSVKLVAA